MVLGFLSSGTNRLMLILSMPSFRDAVETSIYSPRAKDLVNLRAAIPLCKTSASVTSVISPEITNVPLSTDRLMSSFVNPATARDT